MFCRQLISRSVRLGPRRFLSATPARWSPAQSQTSWVRMAAAVALVGGGVGIGAYIVNQKPLQVDEPVGEEPLPELKPATGFDKSKTTVVFVLGGPGAGKGTQCANLVRDFGFVHLSAGDLLRAEQKKPGSQYGELINQYIKDGQIVPMEITIKLLEQAMQASGASRFLIDGFPRKMDQAEKFEELVVESRMVLYFACPEEVMLTRLLKRGETSGRVDDNIDSIRKRFKTFRETSYPVIEHYEKLNKVHTVSCENSPEKVYEQVQAIFTALFKDDAKQLQPQQ